MEKILLIIFLGGRGGIPTELERNGIIIFSPAFTPESGLVNEIYQKGRKTIVVFQFSR
mgnify:CR=1 FL=1